MRLIILLVTLLATNPIFAKKLTLDSEIFNMSDQQWSNLEKSLATAEIPSSFIEEKCFDHHINTLHERYAVSFDGEGHLCRVYDLTFPHLKLLFSGKNSLASIPAQKYTASDFLNWIDGNYDLVYERVSNFQQQEVNLKHQQVASWIKDIRFKKGSAAYANFTNSDEMPASFYASDINFGRDLKFNKFRQGQLKRILVALANSGTGINNLDQWANIIDNPQNLLEKIRFDWNSVKKVYDIALEGQFLPINGPIALVNFDRPHKVFVEGILRRVVQMAMGQVLKTVGGAPGVVVAFAMNEVFLGLDNAYAYQMTRLEASLKDTLESGSLVMSNGQAKRGLNHVYLGQVDLVSEAIIRMVQGREFPWDRLEEMGRKQHFEAEKQRDVMMDHSNNFLVKKKGCQTEQAFGYFSLCQKNDTNNLYTLISQFNVFGYNFGPTQIYNYDSPNSVLIKRATSYLLSTGLTLAKTVVPDWITSNLSNFLRDFAFSGMAEEAYLLSEITLEEFKGGTIEPQNETMLNTLYLQNLNVFTPKSVQHEASIVTANKKLLGL